MRKTDALDYFDDDIEALAEALGITMSAVYQWHETVPLLSALRLQALSQGELTVDFSAYGSNGQVRRRCAQT